MQSNSLALTGDQLREVRYWWVNHKRTHRQELDGEFLWSPKRRQSSSDSESSHNMTKILPGDVVFAFSSESGTVRAVGVALSRAREAPILLSSGQGASPRARCEVGRFPCDSRS